MIYLDHAANTPVEPAVLERFVQVEREHWGNPNADHPAGVAARAELNRVTAAIASLLGALPEEVIYTSGATEANNLAIKGIARVSRHLGRHIISTPLEHPSVSGSLTALQERGWEIDLLDVGRDGRIDLSQLEALLRSDTVLVALCAVDSELGTVQPVEQAAGLLKAYPNCRLHVDATQAVGKLPLSFAGADTLSLSAHKFGGLNGSGLLLKRKGLILEPLFHGGTGASLYRSGTPALALAAALETALRLALQDMEAKRADVAERNAGLRAALGSYPRVRINSPAPAIPHILNVSVEGVKGERFQQALAEQGVCVSVKSACSAPGVPSRAVFAVSLDRKNALSSWRLSFSHRTGAGEIKEFLAAFDICYHSLTQA